MHPQRSCTPGSRQDQGSLATSTVSAAAGGPCEPKHAALHHTDLPCIVTIITCSTAAGIGAIKATCSAESSWLLYNSLLFVLAYSVHPEQRLRVLCYAVSRCRSHTRAQDATAELRARRQRAVTAAQSARIRKGMIRYVLLVRTEESLPCLLSSKKTKAAWRCNNNATAAHHMCAARWGGYYEHCPAATTSPAPS